MSLIGGTIAECEMCKKETKNCESIENKVEQSDIKVDISDTSLLDSIAAIDRSESVI